MVHRPLSAALSIGLGILTATARAAVAAPELPLAVDGAVVVDDNVRVGGATRKGARVALHRGAGCKGEPVAVAPAEEAGRFTIAADGFTPPFTISLRASSDKARSSCFDLTVRG